MNKITFPLRQLMQEGITMTQILGYTVSLRRSRPVVNDQEETHL